MTTCTICGHARHARTGEKPVRLPTIAKNLGLKGENLHPSCAVQARKKLNRKSAARTTIPDRFRGTDFKRRG